MGKFVKALMVGLVGAGVVTVWTPAPSVNAANSIVDVAPFGRYTSLALDAAGNPVISRQDWFFNGGLRVVHCDDPNCAGDNEIVTLDNTNDAGWYTSLVLDAAGNPVISYVGGNTEMKVVHCGDPDCAGDNEIVTVDSGFFQGAFTSLALDAAGNPVISYYDAINHVLKVAHCGDPDCAEGNEIATVDNVGDVGRFTSLVLDAAGNPVISYADFGDDVETTALKVAHCGDPDCAGDNEIVTVDSGGITGWNTSLVLDVAGNPVVSYLDYGNGDLKVAHCGDPDCAGDNEIVIVDSAGSVGADTSLVLDVAGNPVISYNDYGNGALKVVRCGDPDCAAGNEIVTVDSGGGSTSLVLDAAGNPVVSYEGGNGALKLAHCGWSACVDRSPPVTSIALDPRMPDGANGWYRSRVAVTITASDDDTVRTTRCVLDPAERPATFDDLPEGPCAIGTVDVDGDHVVYAASIDAAGNTEPVVERALRIDRTAPAAKITMFPAAPDGARGWYLDPVTVAFSAEPGATLRCVTNPATVPTSYAKLPNRPCTTFTVARFGRYRVYAAAADPAGNSGPVVEHSFNHLGRLRCHGHQPTHVGTAGADVIRGTPRPDVIVALGGNDVIRGRGGNDLICAGAGNDRVNGGAGNDQSRGGAGNDQSRGGAGNDRLFGGAGDDKLFGGPGNDRLFGGPGNDLLDGGPGSNYIRGGSGNNRVVDSPAARTLNINGAEASLSTTAAFQPADTIETWLLSHGTQVPVSGVQVGGGN